MSKPVLPNLRVVMFKAPFCGRSSRPHTLIRPYDTIMPRALQEPARISRKMFSGANFGVHGGEGEGWARSRRDSPCGEQGELTGISIAGVARQRLCAVRWDFLREAVPCPAHIPPRAIATRE